MLEISCARCGRKLIAGEEQLGKQLRCSGCGNSVLIMLNGWHGPSRESRSLPAIKKRSWIGSFSRNLVRIMPRAFNLRRGATVCLAVAILLGMYFAGRSQFRSNLAAGEARNQKSTLSTSSASSTASNQQRPQSGESIDQYPEESKDDASLLASDHAALENPLPLRPSTKPPKQAKLGPANSLPTGTRLIEDQNTEGHGELEAINGTNQDACLIVVDAYSHLRVRKVYIRAQDTLTLDRLDRGQYTIFFATGVDWNDRAEEFNREASYSKFGKSLDFEETRDSRGVHFDHHSITLHTVVAGNVHAKSLTKEQFHRLTGKT